ncbi:MAG: hypothetical protein AMXMBFR33_10320 [Candidatus Xenobia bacterium]
MTAEIIYTNGDIVTVTGPEAEALAVGGGKILAVGSRDEVMKLKGPDTEVVDLRGHTLCPGFVDGHSHFMNAPQIVTWANVSPAPVGPVHGVADIVAALKAHVEKHHPAKGEWIIGYGYDGNELSERRELNVDDLDPNFPDNPVLLIHVSNHGAVLNTAALRHFNITADTPTPPSGIILRKPCSQEPAGLIMETAFLPVFAKLPKPNESELLDRFEDAQQTYASCGVTTAVEGMTVSGDLKILQKAAEQGRLYLDVVSYVMILELEEILNDNPPETFGKYHNRLKLGGAKAMSDGSPQGRTAFFTQPYLTGGPNGQENWRGEPTLPPETFKAMLKLAYDNGLHVHCHSNGDAAIDMFLMAHEYAAGDDPGADRRSTVIHSQFVRKDQLEKYVRYKIIPSFYTEHTFLFADAHMRNLGPERTHFLSPMKTALEMGLHCTNHTDYSVAPLNQLWTMWSAVNRLSRSGEVIGPDERVTPLQALRAITIEGAYQHGEEATKGSLEVGKLADLVILSANPLKVEPNAIKDIQVLQTIKEGRSIFRAEALTAARARSAAGTPP